MRVLVLLLALASAAQAQTLVRMSSFDVVDDQSSNTDLLPTEWTTTIANGAADADIDVTTGCNHGASYGGTATSTRGLSVNPESGETAYISLPSGGTISSTIADFGMSMKVTALPSGEREIFAFYEGSTKACNYRLQSNGTIKAYYGTELQFTSPDAMYLKHCTGHTDIGCSNAVLAGTDDGDCTGLGTPTCTGAQYWAELEFRQISVTGTNAQVACDLWWYGRQEWATTYDATPEHTPAAVTDIRAGAPGSESIALDACIDDVALVTEGRAGHGFVGFLYPNAAGTGTTSWSVTTPCTGGGTAAKDCTDDYATTVVDSTQGQDNLKADKANKSIALAFTDPSSSELSGLTVSGVEVLTVGRTSNGASSSVAFPGRIQTCPSGTCALLDPTTATVTFPTTVATIWHTLVSATSPAGDWSLTQLNALEFTASNTTAPTGGENMRFLALGAYYLARKAELVEARTLHDHNAGTNDGLITICAVGDSLCTASAGGGCSNDPATLCNQESYCSWDSFANGGFQDLPTGGCTTDTQCQTCSDPTKRATLNNGAGAPCTAAAQCPVSAGNPVGALATCNTSLGECNDNAAIPCTQNSDCTGWGGTCATTATCNDSCPGGTCPASNGQGSWAATLVGKINMDNLLLYCQGTERLYTMLDSRFDQVLASTDTHETVRLGADAPCDYILVMEGSNDLTDFLPAPTCAEASSIPSWRGNLGGMLRDDANGYCRANCTATQRDIQCDDDTDCSTISADSKCVGATAENETSANGYACLTTKGADTCSRRSFAVPDEFQGDNGECNTNADCPGGTCSINDATSRQLGFCVCDSNSDCIDTTNFACVGGACRRKCTTDSSCTTTTRSLACKDQGGGVKVCAGRCTCPCNARSCTTDSDCGGTTLTSGAYWSWVPAGTCSAGKCTECGPELCPTAGHAAAWKHTMRTVGGPVYAGWVDVMRAKIAALSDPGDGLPVLIMVEQPNHPAQNSVCGNIGNLWADSGHLRQGNALAAGRGARVATGGRTAFERLGRTLGWTAFALGPSSTPPYNQNPTGILSDFIHFSPTGATTLSDVIATYMGTLGGCATGSGVTLAPQRYCLNYVTNTYATSGGPNSDGTCTTSATCSARETCALRPCTTNDASITGCPSTVTGDTCRIE
jgi:hypothetical protein